MTRVPARGDGGRGRQPGGEGTLCAHVVLREDPLGVCVVRGVVVGVC